MAAAVADTVAESLRLGGWRCRGVVRSPPLERRVVRYGRGRDRAAGGDSRPASSLGPGARAAPSDREGHRSSSRARACGWSRREPRRCPDSSLSRGGHRARAGRGPGDHVERRVISPGSRPGKRPVKPRQSRSAAAARISNNRSSGRTTQGICSPVGSRMCRRNRLPRRSISRSGPSSATAGPRDTASACRFGAARSGGSGDYGDHARQARRRPQSWAFGATGLGHCEIAPPSAARNHPVRRH